MNKAAKVMLIVVLAAFPLPGWIVLAVWGVIAQRSRNKDWRAHNQAVRQEQHQMLMTQQQAMSTQKEIERASRPVYAIAGRQFQRHNLVEIRERPNWQPPANGVVRYRPLWGWWETTDGEWLDEVGYPHVGVIFGALKYWYVGVGVLVLAVAGVAAAAVGGSNGAPGAGGQVFGGIVGIALGLVALIWLASKFARRFPGLTAIWLSFSAGRAAARGEPLQAGLYGAGAYESAKQAAEQRGEEWVGGAWPGKQGASLTPEALSAGLGAVSGLGADLRGHKGQD